MGGAVSIQPSMDITPIVQDVKEFPKLGIKLSYLQTLIKNLPEDERIDSTTEDICEKFIKPITLPFKCTYCEFLQCIDPSVIGQSTVFISHAWKSRFFDVVDALLHYFSDEPEIIIWLDLFSSNHHQTPDRSFEWWENTFKTGISEIGRTVMLLAPWGDFLPLTRTWCLWELYCTIAAGCDFDIAISTKSEARFIAEMEEDATTVLRTLLETIDAESSETSNPIDKEQLFNAMNQTIGFFGMNKIIFELIRDWILENFRQEYERRKSFLGLNDTETLAAANTLANIYDDQGKFEEAEPLYVLCLGVLKENFGLDNPFTLTMMNNLASLYDSQGKSEEAKALYTECLEKQLEVLGLENADTLRTMSNLGLLYFTLEEYDKAEPLLSQCLAKRRETLGPEHVLTLRLITKLALLYDYMGRVEESETLYKESLSIQKELLGEDHLDTLETMSFLGLLYLSQGRCEEAEPILIECLEKRKDLLGWDSPTTLSSMQSLAVAYRDQGKFDDAKVLFLECIDRRKAVLGEDHPQTIMSITALNRMYEQLSLPEPPSEKTTPLNQTTV